MFDINGLLEPSRTDLSEDAARSLRTRRRRRRTSSRPSRRIKPSILIGVSTKGGAFNQQVVEAMSRLNARPIIFALSNPTDKAECTAEEAYAWSKGQALYAAGVQFPDVTIQRPDLPSRARPITSTSSRRSAWPPTSRGRGGSPTSASSSLLRQLRTRSTSACGRKACSIQASQHPRDRSDDRNAHCRIHVRQRPCAG